MSGQSRCFSFIPFESYPYRTIVERLSCPQCGIATSILVSNDMRAWRM